MNDQTPASDLERRKKVRLRVRLDLDINPQKYEGRTYYVIKDPVSLRYYRFKEQEHFLIQMMDGKHTLDDAQKEFEKRFRPDRLTLEDLEQFGQQLLTAGLAQNESPQAGKQLFDRRKKRRRSELMQALTNILYIKIPIFDPEWLLTWMIGKMAPTLRRMETVAFWTFGALVLLAGLLQLGIFYELFNLEVYAPASSWVMRSITLWAAWGGIRLMLKTVGFFLASVGLMLAALMLVFTHWATFQDYLTAYREYFGFKSVVYLWAALGIVKVIHEFGHGLSCKYFGGEVHEMGFLFLCFSPCMYCNVSDAWTMPSKWRRIIISGAGIYVELMIAAIATFVWWNSFSHDFINHMSFSLMIVCSVSTVVFNGNPLMRYDGYYVLADWLEIPNLRDRSNRYLQRIVMEHCLGIEVQPEPYMELWRRLLFVTYAVVSWIYRWVVTFTILKFMATFLKPYKLEVISYMLMLMAAGSMVGWPLYRLGKNIHKRGRLPDMKPMRVTITAAVIAVVLLAFFFLPLPITSRVRTTGLIQVRPDAIEKVPVLLPGTPMEVLVQEGQYVRKGAELAVFQSFPLTKQEIKLRSQIQLYGDQLAKWKPELQRRQGEEQDQVRERLRDAEVHKSEAEKLLGSLMKQKELLVLRAPRDGYVMGLPPKQEQPKPWERQDLEKPFCHIGNPTKLRMLVPVAPDDYEVIRTDIAKLPPGHHLEVTLRVEGFGGKLWKGHVSHLPRTAEKTVPVALTTKGGGPLAIKPSSQSGDPNNPEPQSQVYLISVDFEDPDRAVSPGTLGQAKVHCEPRSCAWWVWRTLSATFDLGLW
jgi:putative peptide zinc metalloprotease protein